MVYYFAGQACILLLLLLLLHILILWRYSYSGMYYKCLKIK